MIKNGKKIAVLICICTVIALLLALTNSITAPIIQQNQNAAANKALLQVMPEGKGFEDVDLSQYKLPATVTKAHKEISGLGYVVELETSGFGPGMVIMCGVTTEGVVTGAVCLASNETLSKEKTYGENFKNKDSAAVEAVETIAGATMTSAAYKNAVKDAMNAAILLGGGDVDIRTPEQILADNLSEALPAGDSFTKVFMVEEIEGADAIYSADNGAGYVWVAGEQFIGVDAEGKVLTEEVAEAQKITDAIAKIKATTYEDLDVSGLGELSSYVLSAKKTATGNYLLETKGAGYGIKGGNEWHPASGEYIVIRIAISAKGEILDCITVSESETDNLGDACAKEEFYGQFDGKNETNYTEIDGISGATLTTDGYKQAIQNAFDAVKFLSRGGK